MRTPARVYELSLTQLPTCLPEHSYADDSNRGVCAVTESSSGDGGQVFVGGALAGEVVGLQPNDEGRWLVHLGPLRLGVLHGRSRTVVPLETGVTHVPGHGTA